jgi:hypothetical protein
MSIKTPDDVRLQIKQIAETLGKPIQQIGEDLLKVCEWIDGQGNHGYTTVRLEQAGLPVYMLTGESQPIWSGILFYRQPEGKKDPFSGFMVRRRPPWMETWCSRYGEGTQRCEEYRAAVKLLNEQKRREAEEAARPKRSIETFCQGRFANYATEQIGIKYAIAMLMADLHYARSLHNMRTARVDLPDRFGSDTWASQANLLLAELEYRQATGDLESTAILKERITRYYTKAQQDAVLNGTANLFDLDPAHPLPPVPHVVHVRSRAWVDCDPAERVYLGRKMKEFPASVWSNPHKAAEKTASQHRIVCEAYEYDLLHNPDRLAQLSDLRGKRMLGCWCKAQHPGDPDLPCHGDILVKYLSMSDDQIADLVEQAIEWQVDHVSEVDDDEPKKARLDYHW